MSLQQLVMPIGRITFPMPSLELLCKLLLCGTELSYQVTFFQFWYKHCLCVEYHVHIWQLWLQLSYNNACSIWKRDPLDLSDTLIMLCIIILSQSSLYIYCRLSLVRLKPDSFSRNVMCEKMSLLISWHCCSPVLLYNDILPGNCQLVTWSCYIEHKHRMELLIYNIILNNLLIHVLILDKIC